jgi:hypothetical protein
VKKPVNKFAIFLWVLALIVFVGDVTSLVQMPHFVDEATGGSGTWKLTFNEVWLFVGKGLISSAIIAAFGYLIELVDQIRWNAQHPSK